MKKPGLPNSLFILLRCAKGTLFLLLSLFLLQCSNNYVEGIERSSVYQFKPGFPELNIVTAGIVDPFTDSTFINVSAEIMYSSLIFRKADSLYEANILLEVQILDEVEPENIIEVFQFPITSTLTSRNQINSKSSLTFNRNIAASPGEYLINVSVTDRSTNKQTVRTSGAYLPNPEDEVSHITNIRVFSKDESISAEFNPVTTYDLSAKADSVRFTFQVTNNKPNEPLTISTRLIKFRSDTSIARPMSWPNYTPSSLPYVGISYSKYDELSTSKRIITQPGNVTIEFFFTDLERGNYRFEVSTEAETEEEVLFRAREFAIKSKNYPTLRSAQELAAPLAYLMEKKEYEALMEITNPTELKQAMDRFWLNNIKNERIAQNVIQLFYERVEEANKQFSNYKEGWKTDFGMMYILFGPPRYISSSINDVVWSYSTNLYDPESNFLFRNPKVKSKFYPFDNYLLQRNQEYFSVQYQQVQSWLSGDILRDNL